MDELEQLVKYYQTDLQSQQDEPEFIQETDNTPQHLDKLSTELAAKRL